jgi:hypothetical protein
MTESVEPAGEVTKEELLEAINALTVEVDILKTMIGHSNNNGFNGAQRDAWLDQERRRTGFRR